MRKEFGGHTELVHPQLILAGDIGGTNTRLALFDGERAFAGRPRDLPERARTRRSRRCSARSSPCTLKGPRRRPSASPGPVRDGRVQVTNLAWPVDASILGMTLGLDQVLLLNDLEANAWGLAALGDDDFHVLNEGRPGATGNAAVCSAGTGLGEAGLYWDGEPPPSLRLRGRSHGFRPVRRAAGKASATSSRANTPT